MKLKLFTLLLGLVLLLLFVVYNKQTDADPVTVSDVRTWTAPTDPPEGVAVAEYDLRYTDDQARPWADWIRILNGVPVPGAPGTPETALVSIDVVTDQAYYFAIKSIDAAGNVSSISNIISVVYPDTIPPVPIMDLL
jgi:hypothetical protein